MLDIRRTKNRFSMKILLAVLALVMVAAASWWTGFRSGVKHQGAPTGHKLLFYRNPMNPAITSPTPAKDEMGMDYVPVYADDAQKPAKSLQQQADDFFADTSPPKVPGLSAVTLTPQGIQLSGVQVAEAVTAPVQRTIRTVGIVVPDETRIHRVQIKTSGWIEQLFVNFSGQAVKQGEPIFSLYSPELVSSQEEFVKARQLARQQKGHAEKQSPGQQLEDAARLRLKLLNVPDDVIHLLETTGKPLHTVTLLSPADGYVMAKDIFQGQEVRPGMELYTVTDLSRIWVDAEVYEYEAGEVHPGQEGSLTTAFDPSLRLTGKIAYVYPYLNRDSRTLKVRFSFENPNLRLKPGMYADITLMMSAGIGIVVPDSAVMDTGVRKIVFVDKGQGRFEPREITSGVSSNGKIQILSGIKAHDHVVIHANFLLDSESNLKAMIDAAMAPKQQAGP
jgi:RND family efflux transporter MFP subunit